MKSKTITPPIPIDYTIIRDVCPTVLQKDFTVKIVIGESFTVEAEIFACGNHAVSAHVKYRLQTESAWKSVPMEPIGDDRYRATFTPDAAGQHLYWIEAWSEADNTPNRTDEQVLRVQRSRAGFGTWYNLFPQSAVADEGEWRIGTLRDVEKRLDRISRMGFDVVCLSGIQHPAKPYALNPQLGDMADLKHLMTIAANYDMEVAVDIRVPSFKNPNDWYPGRQAVEAWIKQGIRILRIAEPQSQPFGFWKWLIDDLQDHYSGLVMVAACYPTPGPMQYLARLGFTQSYTHFPWRIGKSDIEGYMDFLTQSEPKTYLMPTFWPATPGMVPVDLQTGHEPQFMIRYALAATLGANCGIYGPAYELMEPDVPNEAESPREWPWHRTNKLTYLVGLINHIRRENPALHHTRNIRFCTTNCDAIVAFLKTYGDNRLLIVINTDAYNRRSAMVQVPIWELGIGHDWAFTLHDLITDAYYTWQGEWSYVELDPYTLPIHILRL